MTTPKYDLDGGLRVVRELIQQFAAAERPPASSTPAEFFSTRDLGGGVRFRKEEEEKFQQALTMLAPDEGKPRAISRATVDALIGEAVVTALDLDQKQKDKSLEARIAASVKVLREKLTAPPVEQEVWRAVDRLKVSPEGFALGRVFFCEAGHEEAKRARTVVVEWLKARFPAFPSSAVTNYWPDEFAAQTLCRIRITAGDPTAARQLADMELKTTMAVLNFFASLVVAWRSIPVVCLPGSTPAYKIDELVLLGDPKSWARTVHRHQLPFDLKWLERSIPIEVALHKVSAFLRDEGEPDFRKRLLTAVKWAGKGASAETTEDCFLFYAIALETLLLGGKHHEQLAYKLRLRAAHLLGLTREGRRTVHDHINRLYALRSKMVHNGKTQVPEVDLWLLRVLTSTCIINLLSEDAFKNITTDKAFEQWFEDAVLRGPEETEFDPKRD